MLNTLGYLPFRLLRCSDKRIYMYSLYQSIWYIMPYLFKVQNALALFRIRMAQVASGIGCAPGYPPVCDRLSWAKLSQ